MSAHRLPWRRRRAPSRGQALTEFLFVAAFLLIPLFMLIPVIASLIALEQDVEMAARYAVWERTAWPRAPSGAGPADAWKSDERIAAEIDARIFALDDAPVVSDAGLTAALDPMALRPQTGDRLLRNRAGAGTEAAAYATQRSTTSGPGGPAAVMDDALAALGGITRFDLDSGGLIDATVSVDIVDLDALFGVEGTDMGRLRLSRSSRLLVEAWTGGERRQVEQRISGLLPQQFMDSRAVRAVQDFAAFAPGARELRSDWLEFGHVDIGPLPPARLGPESPSR